MLTGVQGKLTLTVRVINWPPARRQGEQLVSTRGSVQQGRQTGHPALVAVCDLHLDSRVRLAICNDPRAARATVKERRGFQRARSGRYQYMSTREGWSRCQRRSRARPPDLWCPGPTGTSRRPWQHSRGCWTGRRRSSASDTQHSTLIEHRRASHKESEQLPSI